MAEPPSLLARIGSGTRRFGIALIGLGVLCTLAPGLAGAPVVIVVGLLLALAGAVRAVFGWRAWSDGGSPFGVVVGGLALACGLALVLNPVSTLAVVSSIVAVYLVVDGVAELFFSGRERDADGRAWMWGDALFSILLGASMWTDWPLSGLRALGVLVGLKLVSSGALMLRLERAVTRVDAGLAGVRARLDR